MSRAVCLSYICQSPLARRVNRMSTIKKSKTSPLRLPINLIDLVKEINLIDW